MANLINQRWLLAILNSKRLEATGKQEFCPIDCIDSALADALNEAFDSLVVSKKNRTNRSFCEFLARSPRDRITIGNFPDVSAWLAAFEASSSGRKDSEHKKGTNKLAMPLINLARPADFSVYDGEISKDIYDAGQIESDEGITAIITTMPISLDYKVWVASDERESLGMVITALSFWLRLYVSQGQASFSAISELAEAEIEINCVFEGQKSIAFQDITTGTEADRIFAASLDLTVIADLPIASYVKQKRTKINVSAEVMSEDF